MHVLSLKDELKCIRLRREHDTLGEGATCDNVQEMSDTNQLITNKLCEDESESFLFFPRKWLIVIKNFHFL